MNLGQEARMGILFDGVPVSFDRSGVGSEMYAFAVGKAGFTGTATITIETAPSAVGNECAAGAFTPLSVSPICDGPTPISFTLTSAAAVPVDQQIVCAHIIPCGERFVRAQSTNPNVVVLVGGRNAL
jgi:hypothetical protein